MSSTALPNLKFSVCDPSVNVRCIEQSTQSLSQLHRQLFCRVAEQLQTMSAPHCLSGFAARTDLSERYNGNERRSKASRGTPVELFSWRSAW